MSRQPHRAVSAGRRTSPDGLRGPVPERGLRDLAGGVGALLLLLAFVIGIPVLLMMVTPAWHSGIPTWSQVVDSLTRPDDGHLLLAVLTVVAWLAWAAFTVSVVIETVAVVRGIPSPQLPFLGPPQRVAAVLVATAAILLAAPPLQSAPATRPVAEQTTITEIHQPVVNTDDRLVDLSDSAGPAVDLVTHRPHRQAAANVAKGHATQYKTVTVKHGDTLWELAERYLGAGSRYREIADLNYGRPQLDGRTLTEAHWIYPGWVLRLPVVASSTISGRSNEHGSTSAPRRGGHGTYTVQPGDTLWDVAEKRLGDGARYPEIFRLNAGRAQPGGGHLSDPDEIQPGWILRLPQSVRQVPRPPTAPSPVALPTAGREPYADPQAEPSEPSLTPGAEIPVPTSAPSIDGAAAPVDPADVQSPPTDAYRLVLGLSVLAAAGLLTEVTLRRRRQQRVRQSGQRLPVPEQGTAEAEVQLRAAADPIGLGTIQNSLRAVARACREQARDLPRLIALSFSPTEVTLLLGEDSDAVEPFVSLDPRTWRLTSDTALGHEDAPDEFDPYPAMVTLGVTEDSIVLINLEAAGQLALVGEAEVARDVAWALGMELATSPLAAHSVLVVPEWMSALARVTDRNRVTVANEEAAERRATAHVASVGSILESADVSDLHEARSRGTAADTWVPEVMFTYGPIGVLPWSGVVAIHANPLEGIGWTIEVDRSGLGRVVPLGLDVDLQRLGEQDRGQMLDLLRTANAHPEPQAVVAEEVPSARSPVSGADVARLALAALPRAATVPDVGAFSTGDSPAHPRVLVLGRIEIEGLSDGEGSGRRARASELLAYLVLHPGATAYELDEALWPGRRVPKETRNPFVSRVRHWLGVDAHGQPYLPLVGEHGDYRLSPAIACDWHDFLRLARAGLERGLDGSELLVEALALVRGRPFLGVDPASYSWAERDTQEMISSIVDVAHSLAVLRLGEGDGRGAQLAAGTGLQVDPCSESLHRDAISGARIAGDRDAATSLIGRLRVSLSALDPDAEPESETLDLIADVDQWLSVAM
jgi:LysM repeat protein